MKLTQRIAFHVLFFALVYCVGLVVALDSLVAPRFAALEEARARDDAERVRAVIAQDLEALDENLLGYAYWDDSCLFMDSRAPGYLELNFSKGWLDSLRVGILGLADASGAVVHQAAYDPVTGAPLELGSWLADSPEGRALAAAPGFEAATGFLDFGGRLVLAASRPIRDSSGEGPSRGRMIFGRFYGKRDAERLSALLRVELSFEAADGAIPIGAKGVEPLLSDEGGDFRVVAPIPGIAGGFAGAIVLRHEKLVIAEGAGIIRAVLAVTTTVGLILLAALFLVMQRGAAMPVIRLSARARELAAGRDFSERLPAGRGDEIGELADSFNGLLDRLAAANRGLEERVAERTEELLRANDELRLMGEVFSHAREGILVTDADARILAVNPAFERITGISSELAVGRNPRVMRGGRQGPEFYRTLWERLARDGAWSGELWNKRPSGEEYPIWISISALKGPEGETTRYVGVLHDISESKRQEEIIRYQAFHDELTGLPNRHLLSDRVTSAIERAKRRGLATAIVFLDLDRFKLINDSLGHAAGDELLKETARRLSRVARGEDTIARLGGDEFVILLEEVADGRIPADVALRVIKSLGRPVDIDGKSVRVGASVGIAIFPEDGADAETLLRNADAAMYRAKEEGRNTYRLFTAELNEKVARRLSVESELRRDVESRSLLVRYQPQVRLATGKTAGLEALVRWRNRSGEIIRPDEFIPIAEETGLVVDIDRLVMELALSEAAGLLATSDVRLALNCSARGLRQKDLPDRIAALLAGLGLPPERLEIEITETAIMHDVQAGVAILRRIADIGVSIALDDFGTGYSSLGQLKRLPLDSIKIDKSFVSNLFEDEHDRSIVDTILTMARRLDLSVVAEGVESETQAAYLREAGCDLVQGFYYAKPLSWIELEGFLAAVPPEQGQGPAGPILRDLRAVSLDASAAGPAMG